jgi:streptogramin lyase
MATDGNAPVKGGAMILKLNGNTRIDNLRNHPAEVVEKLRALLSHGAHAYPDPHRQNFYDVENGSRTFYVHIAPTGNVWLLASWLKAKPAMVEVPSGLTTARS